MNNNYKTTTSAVGDSGTVLLIVFIVLKLTGNITWSWVWVLSPLWIGAILAAVMFIVIVAYKLARRHRHD